jgi:hypothetical protein
MTAREQLVTGRTEHVQIMMTLWTSYALLVYRIWANLEIQ